MIKQFICIICVLFMLSCEDDNDCYECRLSLNSIEEKCSNVFTEEELFSLEEDCENRGGIWRMR